MLVLGDEDAGRNAADMVARATDALDARGDGRRRLDLDDLVDGAHVDAELERRRGDDGRQLAGLETLLDGAPAVLRDRAVVSERDLLARGLVERRGEPLGEATAVDEDHRRPRSADSLHQARVDLRPDAARVRIGLLVVERPGEARFQVHGEGRRHLDGDGERLLRRCIDDRDVARRERAPLRLG